MSHYRAVMGITIDCEGCKFDGDECSSDKGCIAFDDKSGGDFADKPVQESVEEFLRKNEPWMFYYGA